MKWIAVPFTEKTYEVSRAGEIRSYHAQGKNGYNKLKGKRLSKNNPRLLVDVLIVNERGRKSILIHRLVYFCHYYVPSILHKNIGSATWEDFEQMPLIVHKNGVLDDNRLINLAAKLTHQEVAEWSHHTFPERFVLPIKRSSIVGKDAKICTKLLKQGASYPQIIKKLSKPVSDMTIYRFNQAHGIDMGRAYPGLSDEQRGQIPKLLETMNQKQIALHFGVSESCVSRAIRGRKK